MSSVCEIFSKSEMKNSAPLRHCMNADQNEIQSTNRVDALTDFHKMCKEIFSTNCVKWFVSARYCRGNFTFTFTSKWSHFVIQLKEGRDALPYWLSRIKGHKIASNEIDYDMDNTELASWTYSYTGNCFEQDMSNASIDYWDKCGPVIDNAEFMSGDVDATFLSLFEGLIATMHLMLANNIKLSKHQYDNGWPKSTMYVSDNLYMYVKCPFFF